MDENLLFFVSAALGDSILLTPLESTSLFQEVHLIFHVGLVV